MTNYLVLGVSILLAAIAQLLMKKGMLLFGTFPVNQIFIKIFHIFLTPYVFMGLACFALSSVFWLFVLSRLELSLVYPMVSVAYILVALASMFLFKEQVTLIRWTGIFVIIFGVFLISRS
ncbi:MAG: EamA family transporter [Candidatus Margulisiibacteriota bacterium]|nr:EamA family transporter [Candidatus Margulisiibacteriota bacterium]